MKPTRFYRLHSGHRGDDEFYYASRNGVLKALNTWIEGGRSVAMEYVGNLPTHQSRMSLRKILELAMDDENHDDGIHVWSDRSQDWIRVKVDKVVLNP